MKKTTAMCVSTLLAGIVLGQSAPAADYNAGIGLGLGIVPDYEGSEDYTFVPILFGRFAYDNGKYVMLNGNKLKWNLLNDRIEFGPLLQYRGERDDVDNDQVDDLKDVDGAIEAGFFVTGRSGPWSATLEFAADVSGEHDGFLVTLGGNYRQAVSQRLTMTYGLSTTFASDNYMETYFQIDSGNRGTSTLPDYSADDGEFKDIGLNMSADYRVNDRWSIKGNLGYAYLLGDAADSPIVDDEGSASQFMLGLTGVYHF